MNAFENWFCATSFWRGITQRQLLPWILSGADLGDHVLEIGAGPGAATGSLLRRVPLISSLEYSHVHASRLHRKNPSALVVQGDAARLPFPSETFSSALAILVLHHLPSAVQQDAALAEACRVLRPGGRLFLFEINDGWLQRLSHHRSTFVPVNPATFPARLTAAGFSRVTVEFRRFGFSVRAQRPRPSLSE